MKQTEWNEDKDAGMDTCDVQFDDGRTFIHLERKRRGNKTTTVTSFNGTVVFTANGLEQDDAFLMLLNVLKDTHDNIRVKLGVGTPNIEGYNKSQFMLELRQFIMHNDPNCLVPPEYHPR